MLFGILFLVTLISKLLNKSVLQMLKYTFVQIFLEWIWMKKEEERTSKKQ